MSDAASAPDRSTSIEDLLRAIDYALDAPLRPSGLKSGYLACDHCRYEWPMRESAVHPPGGEDGPDDHCLVYTGREAWTQLKAACDSQALALTQQQQEIEKLTHDLSEREADITAARYELDLRIQLLVPCIQYLQDGEKPAECIERQRKDIDATLTLLANEKRDNAALTAERDALTQATRTILRGFDQGVFVRSVSNDDRSDWAVLLLPFLRALAQAQELVGEAKPPAGVRHPHE